MALAEFDRHVASHNVDRATYLGLYAPALSWLLHRAAHCGNAAEAGNCLLPSKVFYMLTNVFVLFRL